MAVVEVLGAVAGGGATVTDAGAEGRTGGASGAGGAGTGASTGSLGCEPAAAAGGSIASEGAEELALPWPRESCLRIAVEMMRTVPMTPATTETLSTATVMSRRRRSGSSTGAGGYSIAADPSVAELVALGTSR